MWRNTIFCTIQKCMSSNFWDGHLYFWFSTKCHGGGDTKPVTNLKKNNIHLAYIYVAVILWTHWFLLFSNFIEGQICPPPLSFWTCTQQSPQNFLYFYTLLDFMCTSKEMRYNFWFCPDNKCIFSNFCDEAFIFLIFNLSLGEGRRGHKTCHLHV